MAFTPRTTCPKSGDKYYNRTTTGGYNPVGVFGHNNSTGTYEPGLNALPNCVGYAIGRFNEIGAYGKCKYFASAKGNAEDFIVKRMVPDKLTVGSEPKLGAVIVWAKGKVLNEKDGAGHVAIVEKIIDKDTIMTSESGYGSSKPFTYRERKRNDGGKNMWGKKSSDGYSLQGFIYNPAVKESTVSKVLTAVSAVTNIAYYKKYTGASYRINEVFRAVGVPEKYIGTYKVRTPVANANGITNYTGTAAQNSKLIGLAKQGKLKKV